MMLAVGQAAFEPGLSEAETVSALDAVVRGTNFLVGSLVVGTLSTAIGGYATARLAKQAPYLNAAALGVVGLVTGAFFAEGELPLWFNVIGFAVVLPASLLGAFVANRKASAVAVTLRHRY